MLRLLRSMALSACVVGALPVVAEPQPTFETFEQQISYLIGVSVVEHVDFSGFDISDIDFDALRRGFEDGHDWEHVVGYPFDIHKTNIKILELRAIEQASGPQPEDLLAAGRGFLERNAKRDGVVTTQSGLQYRVYSAGNGARPTASQTVTVDYEGRLLDGTVFDSTYDRNQQAQFRVDNVIPGWAEVLQLMSPGSRFSVWIPSELAYGARGAGDKIGPHQVLNFKIDLKSVN